MRGRRFGAAALALAAALGSSTPGPAAVAPAPDGARLLVKFAPGAARAAAHRSAGARLLRTLQGLPAWDLVALPRGVPADAALRAYRRLTGVAAAEPDAVARVASPPAEADDPCLHSACAAGVRQWNLDAVAAPLAWEGLPFLTAGTRLADPDPVRVAVLDTAIDASHPDFRNAGGVSADLVGGGQIDLASGRSWIAPGRERGPQAYHGTFVAGILAAGTSNGTDVASVGFPAVIVPLTVVDGDGVAYASAVAEAVAYAHRTGARIMNLSLGMPDDSQAVREAIVAATSGPDGALVVAAAGNNTKDRPFYPGSYPEVMSVSGFDGTGALAPCSNYNDNVSVAAPARHVVSLAPMPERRRVVDCGTSAAAPHVAGVAALLMAQDPSRSAAAVREIIERTADDAGDPGRDAKFGWGRLNADRALHDGRGPAVERLASTVPPRGSATSIVTGVARSSRPILRAEGYLDRPGGSAFRVALRAADGAFDEPVEEVTGAVTVPDAATDSIHAVFVRAFDGEWGAAERARIAVDRTPPEIINVRSDPGVRGTRATISFTIRDAASDRFSASLTIRAPDGVTIVYRTPVLTAPAGPIAVQWTPELLAIPGLYRFEIWVWDLAGNPASHAGQQIVA